MLDNHFDSSISVIVGNVVHIILMLLCLWVQAGALVQVYTDGTVLVTHGGVEMGQGLHTKMAQIAATEFGIALKDVFVSETATDKVPNSSPTAASASADMYGGAVLDACQQLKKRMNVIAAKGNHVTFAEVPQILIHPCHNSTRCLGKIAHFFP